ncbi:MAG: glycerol-3-phosphate dehydrogenase [Bacteroidales bacterium]|nr:glycerol-3-phosphate dehydrogenase [Bacteroidales bacterium]
MKRFLRSEVSVIGSGSWATAIVKMLLPNCDRVCWYVNDRATLSHIRKYNHNPAYLSSVSFKPGKLILTDNINRAVASSPVIILVTPSQYLKSALDDLAYPMDSKIVCTAIKGIVPGQNTVVGEYIHNYYMVPYDNIVVLTGPSHAEEVAMEKMTFITLASLERESARRVASLIKNHFVRTIISDDIFGTEYAAVMKNIYAIGAGICLGLGYGDNFLAVMLSNAANEMKRFIDIVHPTHRDINSSAYLGDLLVTGYSQFSRNRVFGTMIGKGYSVKNALLEMTQVAEGYPSASCIHDIVSRENINLPIASAVYRILYEGTNPGREITNLSKIMV